jgi:hypothetical protein
VCFIESSKLKEKREVNKIQYTIELLFINRMKEMTKKMKRMKNLTHRMSLAVVGRKVRMITARRVTGRRKRKKTPV